MRIGAHVSTAGGFDKAIDRAVEIGAEAIQCFGSSPQSWAFHPVPEEQLAVFREKAEASDIRPVFLHGIYLINLGTDIQGNVRKGVQSLINYMHLASAMGGSGVIFHGGSHKGAGYDAIFKQTVDCLEEVLANSPSDVYLIIENSAGMGHTIGSKFNEIARILEAVDSPQLRVCMDTQHAFASGYDLRTAEGVAQTMEEFDREIGLDRLVAVHANDSKTEFASGVDRHENIGMGSMGEQAFLAVAGHPAFKDVPFLLEVPGLEGKGPDKANVDKLKQLRLQAGLAG